MTYYAADFETTTEKPTLYTTSEHIAGLDVAPDVDIHVFSNDPDAAWEDANDTHVWSWGIAPILKHPHDDDVVRESTGIAQFIQHVMQNTENNDIIAFHNFGKFDVGFLIPGLIQMGFERDDMASFLNANGKETRRKNPRPGSWGGLCSDSGDWYELRFTPKKGHTVVFRDSVKLIPGSVDSISKDLKTGAKKLKGTIDYSKDRPVGYIMDAKEEKYLVNDVLVMSEALFKMFEEVEILQDCMTIGGAALREFHRTLGEAPPNGSLAGEDPTKHIKQGKENFRALAPALDPEVDAELRVAYRGGWCINNTEGQIIEEEGFTFDVNSLYPSVMYNHVYPIGAPAELNPKQFKNVRQTDQYFVRFSAEFDLKPNHVPFLQEANGRFGDQTHITSSNGEVKNLTLSRPDYELFMEQYDVNYIDIEKLWVFASINHLFDRFVKKFYDQKNSNKVNGVIINAVLYLFSKLMLNNLYGKMAQAPTRLSGIPLINEKGQLRYNSLETTSDGGYVPIGAYITAYARCVTIRAAQAVIDAGGIFDYADTDSIHARGLALQKFKEIINVGKELGQWEHEKSWDIARFVRQKTYIERDLDGHLEIKACGAPEAVKERLRYNVTTLDTEGGEHTFYPLEYGDYDAKGNLEIVSQKRTDMEILERFDHGLVEAGKIMKQVVSGGINFRHTTFSIH